MKRLLFLTIALIVSCVAVCTTLIIVTQVQPIPPMLTDDIRFCGGQICFRGVVVGQTPLDGVLKLLSGDPGMTFQRNGDEVSASTRRGTVIFATLPEPLQPQLVIEYIEIDFWNRTDSYPMLGEFILRYGVPCKVAVNARLKAVTLYYPTMYLNLANSDGSRLPGLTALTPFSSVNSIIAYNDATLCTVRNSLGETLWPGWRRLKTS